MPTEGCSLWSDNMVIPVGAPNVGGRVRLDGLHLPARGQRAALTEYITYISPVEGVQDLVKPELAKDPLVFPQPKSSPRKCTDQDSPPDIEPVNEAWQEVITG